MSHRKRVKHFDEPGQAHELTFSCYRRFRLLEYDEFKRILSNAIDRAVENHHFMLNGFVFMPEHVHLIVFPLNEEAKIANLLSAIKQPSSFRIKQWMLEHDPESIGRLTIGERPGKTTFRFWQEGPGYDRNITSLKTLRQMIDYVHRNPIRRGLCKLACEWPWSSWHHYDGDEIPPDIPTVHGLPEGELFD